MRFRSRSLAILAAAALAGGATVAAATPAVTVAEMAGMPSSPGFKMTLNKGATGAPEATAIGAQPIALKASAAAGKDEKPATPKEAGNPITGKLDLKSRVEKPTVAPASKPADASTAKTADKDVPVDPMDLLRQRLAEKLGATPAADGKFAMRVSNRGESGENIVSTVRPSAAALASTSARRAAAKRVARPASDSAEANANIAAYGPPDAKNTLLPTQWDYVGAGGPQSWARLDPANATCATGARQSPIDIRGGIAVDLEPIKFEYRPSAFSVVDNGHTVQVDVEPGNAITITGRRYELQQFHFHRPSEERVNGRQYDMVVHLVHKDAQGNVAVIAVLLDRGAAQDIVQAVWNNLPLEKGDEVRGSSKIDLARLLPQDRRYYTYMGSLTTPPCSEGVLWMVMKQPVPVSPQQLDIFARLYPMNARPIQQADGRLIKESN